MITILLAAWATLLHRYSNQDELLISTPMACRKYAANATQRDDAGRQNQRSNARITINLLASDLVVDAMRACLGS